MALRLALVGILLAATLNAAASAAAAPRVVSTIVPVHSLVAEVMAGVAEPRLLLHGTASPHDYALRPSDAVALANADLVVWVGPALETFLSKPLQALAGGARVVALQAVPGMRLLPIRRGGAWEADDHAHAHAHAGSADEVDPHLWLDPENAAVIADAVAAVLAGTDPENAAAYLRNRDRLRLRLEDLRAELTATLQPVRERPYIVFHDAYQYFERSFATRAVGAIALAPERRPGARRLQELRQRIAQAGVVCLFAEPQFEPRLVHTLLEGTSARHGVLDPIGAGLVPGPEAYVSLMRALAGGMRDCLAG